MANADLRMQIVTALDAAGIKASQKEIDNLASKLDALGKSNATEKLEAKLTKLPGKLNDIVGAMGKFGKALGVAGAMVEAFKMGWEIGSWINDKFVSPLLWAGDKAQEVAEKKIAKAWDTAWKTMEKSNANAIKGLQQTGKLEDQEIQRVKELTQQYLKAYSAKNTMANASMDAEMQKLEVEQFQDEMSLIDQGREDAIPELQAYYDMLKQEMKTKKEIAAFDAQTETERIKNQTELNNKLLEFDTKLNQRKEKIALLEKQRDDAEEAFFSGSLNYKRKEKWLDKDEQLKEQQAELRREMQIIELEKKNFLAGDVFDVGQYNQIRAAQRATLASRLSLEAQKLGFNYNSLVTGQGTNLLGFGPEYFQEKMTQDAQQSFKDLSDIERNTANLAEKLDKLLGLK